MTPSRSARYKKLKMSETVCHSAPPQADDAESRVFIYWIPAPAGMTIFLTPKQSFEEFFYFGLKVL